MDEAVLEIGGFSPRGGVTGRQGRLIGLVGCLKSETSEKAPSRTILAESGGFETA